MHDVWNVFRFCPRCGHPLKLTTGDDGQELRCTNDNFVFYQNPHSAVLAIITNDKKEIMMVKRNREPALGTWDFPGGFANWGESADIAIAREIEEELGTQLTIKSIFGTYHDWYEYKGIRYSTATTAFVGSINALPTTINQEIAELRWFAPNELPENTSFESTAIIVQELRK